MLEALYAAAEKNSSEAASVRAFAAQFVKNGEMEEMFYEAIRDSRLSGFRLSGFRDGVKVTLGLCAEVQ